MITHIMHPDGIGAATTEISLVEFADTFAAKTNSLDLPDMHPAGANTIWDWLLEMRAAAEAGRPHEVARLARMVTTKVAWERQWQEEYSALSKRVALVDPPAADEHDDD